MESSLKKFITSSVIASPKRGEAISSHLGLLRRFAPRNDTNFLILLVIGLSLLINLTGCSRSPSSVDTSLNPEHQLQKLAKDEYDLNLVTKRVGNTVWVYLPFEHNIFEFKTPQDAASKEKNPVKQYLILYLEDAFKDNNFQYEYDIVQGTKAAKDPGYANNYTDEFNTKVYNLSVAISRVYFNLEEVPGDVTYLDAEKQATHQKLVDSHVIKNKVPEFFVVVFADIKNGVELIKTFNLQDFKRYFIGDLPPEEYSKREIVDSGGGESIINDRVGKHLSYSEIKWPEFLTEQITNRIHFQYEQSDFHPDGDPEDTILKIIAETAGWYNYKDFTAVQLHNLRSDKTYLFNQDQLKTFLK